MNLEVIELKQAFNIEITFEDICNWIESLKLDYIEIYNETIIVNIEEICFIEYYKNGDIKYNFLCDYTTLFENLSMYQLYQQLKLKIENIEENKQWN